MKFWIFYLILFSLLLGYIGSLIILLMILIYIIYKKNNLTLSNNFFGRFHTKSELKSISFDNKIDTIDISNLTSYQDIVSFGTSKEKINLITILLFKPTYYNVNLIREMLNDKEEIIRILASNALQKMETTFEEKIIKEKDNRKKIDLYIQYLNSNLIDPLIKDLYYDKLKKLLEMVLENDNEFKFDHIKLMVLFYNYKDTEKIFSLYNQTKDERYKFLMAIIYLNNNQFNKFKQIVMSIKNTEFKEQIDFWKENILKEQ